ncbi:MAG: hypothetical protein ACD_36C00119G0002 [uncultured bacterium]|nr:MAG: hypothetical protein ACD_36C00119G0002 [uncultured bacterium]
MTTENHSYGCKFNSDSPLSLNRITIENLLLHVPLLNSPSYLQEPIGKCRLAMIYVGDDSKISDVILHEAILPRGCAHLLYITSNSVVVDTANNRKFS